MKKINIKSKKLNNYRNKLEAKELHIQWLKNYYVTYMLKDSGRTKEMILDLIRELLDSEKEFKMIQQLESTFNANKFYDDDECNIELNRDINFLGGILGR